MTNSLVCLWNLDFFVFRRSAEADPGLVDQVEAKAHTISEKAHQVISAKVSLAGDVKEAVIDKTIAGVEGVKEILAGTYFTSKILQTI